MILTLALLAALAAPDLPFPVPAGWVEQAPGHMSLAIWTKGKDSYALEGDARNETPSALFDLLDKTESPMRAKRSERCGVQIRTATRRVAPIDTAGTPIVGAPTWVQTGESISFVIDGVSYVGRYDHPASRSGDTAMERILQQCPADLILAMRPTGWKGVVEGGLAFLWQIAGQPTYKRGDFVSLQITSASDPAAATPLLDPITSASDITRTTSCGIALVIAHHAHTQFGSYQSTTAYSHYDGRMYALSYFYDAPDPNVLDALNHLCAKIPIPRTWYIASPR